MPDLGDFLVAASHRKHRYGEWDCCTFPADWCIANGWPDPMAEWRGGYIDASAADDGLLPLFAAGMFGSGIGATKEPVAGDVGVVSVLGQEAGAIFTGKRWALVAPRGLAFASLEPSCVLMAWSVTRG
ncbi:conserved hypothetical protein [Novosphingobium aromaticivorans DSM 12444]|uniref:DUF6950 domain-containing protein n=1 Tax=Novosphingobium aromaticivorans (strain ATCC 700278 / DSM 12444 / CCUG 56034 / CIP 105152 / NBRC 16084 / F199) TaxID=279238 RepID=Q2G4P9_NOVAD|nr:hypothetical protein [Novosphingobium aromaticivorans]ABD27174.1 conserved hypothetical protein [Novosphingobium aromaticivorans DSM 12444]SCY89790.1 hypothetical protein SAMN05660666_03493 [Novosphingobium aromaticivorans]